MRRPPSAREPPTHTAPPPTPDPDPLSPNRPSPGRSRLKALGRTARERYCRSLKHLDRPRGNWHALWDDLDAEIDDLEVIWSPLMAGEMQAACARELATIDAEADAAIRRGAPPPPWDGADFAPPSHARLCRELFVPPFYVAKLLGALNAAASDDSSAPPPLGNGYAYLLALWQRCVVERRAEHRALMVRAIGAVYAVIGADGATSGDQPAAEPVLPCVAYLVDLVGRAPRTPPAVLLAALDVLRGSLRRAGNQNAAAILDRGGIDTLTRLLLLLPPLPALLHSN